MGLVTLRSAKHSLGARLEGVEQAHDMRVVHLGQHIPLRLHMVHLPTAQKGCASSQHHPSAPKRIGKTSMTLHAEEQVL